MDGTLRLVALTPHVLSWIEILLVVLLAVAIVRLAVGTWRRS